MRADPEDREFREGGLDVEPEHRLPDELSRGARPLSRAGGRGERGAGADGKKNDRQPTGAQELPGQDADNGHHDLGDAVGRHAVRNARPRRSRRKNRDAEGVVTGQPEEPVASEAPAAGAAQMPPPNVTRPAGGPRVEGVPLTYGPARWHAAPRPDSPPDAQLTAGSSLERLLLRLRRVMTTKVLVGLVAILLAVSLAAFAGVLTTSTTTGRGQTAAKAPSRSLPSSRLIMLLPDGRVEVTDAWARRVYRWDGRRWVEVEATRLPSPEAELR